MKLKQEDIDIYLNHEKTKEFYDEYNKSNKCISKLLELSKEKIFLYEPLELDHFLLIDISINCNQKFKISNENQYNRYIDLLYFYYNIFNKINNTHFKINNMITNDINDYDINNSTYSLNYFISKNQDDYNISKIRNYIYKLINLLIINKFILNKIKDNLILVNDIDDIIINLNFTISNPFTNLSILYLHDIVDFDIYKLINDSEYEIYQTKNNVHINYLYNENIDDKKIKIIKNNTNYNCITQIYNLHELYYNCKYNKVISSKMLNNLPPKIIDKYITS